MGFITGFYFSHFLKMKLIDAIRLNHVELAKLQFYI